MKRTSRSGRVIRPSSIRNVPSRVMPVSSVGPLVDRVDVPEARHVEAALDRRGELVPRRPRRRRSARGSSARGRRASRPARARGRSSARRRRRAPPSGVSCTTAWATPSWISGSGALGTPSASNARGSVRAKRGESLRLMAGAATRVPSRPVSAPRPSAWARPLKRQPAEELQQRADGVGLEHDGVVAGRQRRPARVRSTLAAARRAIAPASRSRAAVDAAGAPARAPGVVAGDDLQVGVGGARRAGARRVVEAIAVSTSPAVQMPKASRPALGADVERGAQRAARVGGVERGGGGVEAVVRAGRPAARAGRGGRRGRRPPRPRVRRRPRAAPASAGPSSEWSLVLAAPVWPSWTRSSMHGGVVDRVAWVGARAREAREQRALAHDRHLRRRRRADGRARARPGRGRARRRSRSRDADLDVAEARRRGAVRDGHDLPGLALAAVRQAPEPATASGPPTASSEPQKRGVIAGVGAGCGRAGRARRRGSRGRPRWRTGSAAGGRRSTTSGWSRGTGRRRCRRAGRRASRRSPGSTLTLVMRTIGWRAKPSARAQPPEPGQAGGRRRLAVAQRDAQHAAVDQRRGGRRRRPRRPSRTCPGRRAASRRR